MLLGPPPGDDDNELQKAPIPEPMLKVIAWARGLRLLVAIGLPPIFYLALVVYILVRLVSGHDIPQEVIKAMPGSP